MRVTCWGNKSRTGAIGAIGDMEAAIEAVPFQPAIQSFSWRLPFQLLSSDQSPLDTEVLGQAEFPTDNIGWMGKKTKFGAGSLLKSQRVISCYI